MPSPPPPPTPPLIAISMGDPGGVGPEVIVKALEDPALRARARWVITGNATALQTAAASCHLSPFWTLAPRLLDATNAPSAGQVQLHEPVPPPSQCTTHWPARPTAEGGAASLAYVHQAITLAQDASIPPAWRASAIVTAPISKEAWMLAGESRYPGHTELFAERFASPKSAMMFVAEPSCEAREHAIAAGLHVILVTTHVPLAAVSGLLTTTRVLEVIELGTATLRRLGIAAPRIGVCGVNPHAGEAGLLGHEDDTIIAPALAAAKLRGLDATGPHPADTIFQRALAWPGKPPARFDLVVAMYHDQGLIPLKLLAFDRAVNITVGLRTPLGPFVRTSPDHGTAYDIAGNGIADAGSMRAALDLAIRLAAPV
jgi:4-phospho-D-threonate 3-dehydrogenase / 4-phospho-D-erythronate 3-dehydrogenase